MAYYQTTPNYDSKMKSLNNQIDSSIEKMMKNNDVNKYLDVAARFPKFSQHNVMLVYSQNPNATMVQSYTDWKAIDRQVQQGEKSMTLLQPKYEQNDKNEQIRTGYKQVPVFDIQQTKGRELATIREAVQKDFVQSQRSNDMYRSLHNHIQQKAPQVEISAQPDFTDRQQYNQMLTNYANHYLQRVDPADQFTREKAEAVTVTVNKYYGLDDEGYKGNINDWAKDASTARQGLESIQRVSSTIIRQMDELNKQRIQEIKQTMTLSKDGEREAFLKGAQIEANQVRQDIKENPKSFDQKELKDIKILVGYAERMEKNKPITARLAEGYDRIRQDVDRNFDNPNVQNSAKYKMVDYIEKYERAGGLDKDIERHEPAKDNVVSISKSKSNELER